MSARRSTIFILAVILGIQIFGMIRGSSRLAWAAVQSLTDFNLILKRGTVWVGESNMSETQREFLRAKLPETNLPVHPRISVNVAWDYAVLARVRSHASLGPGEAESNDAIYLNLAGLWIEIYSFGHSIT